MHAANARRPNPSGVKVGGHQASSASMVSIMTSLWFDALTAAVGAHFDLPPGGRQISLLGDAELDEGAIWECVADPMVGSLGEVLWVVDLNRQSLDRVVPGIQVAKWEGLFRASGWQVLEVKYGRLLQSLFTREGGERLRARIDTMGNEEYQWLLRSPAESLRGRLGVGGLLDDLSDAEVATALRDLGGHDLASLREALNSVDEDRPTVVFAYTIKGRGLPVEGHPANHSALLSEEQYVSLAAELDQDPQDPWAPLSESSPTGRLCAEVACRLSRPEVKDVPPPAVPQQLGRAYRGAHSTQATLGRVLTDLARDAPEVAARIVTVSPDVASSTNTGGWINKVGVWSARTGTTGSPTTTTGSCAGRRARLGSTSSWASPR